MTKHLLDLYRVNELKNFVTNNLLSWCLKRVLGSTQLVSRVLGIRAFERGTVTTEQVQLSIGVRVQL